MVDESLRRLKALSDPGRLKVLALVNAAGEICVCKIEEILQMPQPTVSRHLNRLKESGWLKDRREGRWVHYRLADKSGSRWLVILNALLASRDLRGIINFEGATRLQTICKSPEVVEID